MLLSIPAVRRRFYEFFVFTHIFLGVSFFGLLWWHIKGEYASVSNQTLSLPKQR